MPSIGIAVSVSFTPHARGSTLLCLVQKFLNIVYPACAGIDLWTIIAENLSIGLPRMRGDRPD